MPTPSYVYGLSLVEQLTPVVLNAISLMAFWRVLRTQLRRATLDAGARYSPTLVLYVLAWVSTMASLYPYLGYMILSWTPSSEFLGHMAL